MEPSDNLVAFVALLLAALSFVLLGAAVFISRRTERHLKVEIVDRLGEPTQARVWRDGRLVFNGETRQPRLGYRRLGDALPIARPLAPCSTELWKDPLLLRCGVYCHTHGVIYTSQHARLHTQQELEQIADKHREDNRRSDEK